VKLPGYLDPSFVPPAPSIYAQIESGVLQGRGTAAFLVDTGASVTTIMDRDRDRLGIDWNRLDKKKRPLSGIGGTVDTRIIRDGILLFKTDTGGTVRERLQVYVARHDTARNGPSWKRTCTAASLATRKRHNRKIQAHLRQVEEHGLSGKITPFSRLERET